MNFRTDLALERQEILEKENVSGVTTEKEQHEDILVTRIEILSDEAEKRLMKPRGKYITVEVPSFSDESEIFDDKLKIITKEIRSLLPEEGAVLVAGLGNREITPDALGPDVISLILATRHISDELAKKLFLTDLRPVSAISPGVLGQTGIETGEIIKGIADRIKPSAIITIDALAARNIRRLGSTVQICDTGISPGSGVGNKRKRLDESTLGVKVISIGVPTVVDAATLISDLTDKENPDSYSPLPESENMMITPKEIDLLIERASKLVAMSINCALQKTLSPEDIFSLVS